MKKVSILLVIVLVLSMSLAACGGGGDGGTTVSNLILATGGTSGTYYPYGGSMAQIWNDNIEGMNVTAQSTGASAENLKLLANGEADLAIVQNDVMDYAFNGTEIFQDQQLSGFSAIGTLYPEVVQIVVRPGLGVETIADLKGKTVSIGDAGSGVEANALQILDAYGLTLEDIDARNLSFKESGSSFQDNQIDAFFVTAGLPNAAIQEICTTKEVNIISIEGAELEQLLDKYPYYTTVTITKDTYAGMVKDATALSIKATLAVSDNLDEDTVYNLTKTLFENLDTFAAAHAKAADLSLESAVQGISIPFHPGAEKYYKEVGALK